MQESMNDYMPNYSENQNSFAATQAKPQKGTPYPSSKVGSDNLGFQMNAETNVLDNSPRVNPIQANRGNRAGPSSRGSVVPT